MGWRKFYSPRFSLFCREQSLSSVTPYGMRFPTKLLPWLAPLGLAAFAFFAIVPTLLPMSQVYSETAKKPLPENAQTAVLGGGCFWCLEALYYTVKGVHQVESGFAGGEVANPSYKAVVTGKTGHAEVVKITYDPAEVTYAELLEFFWLAHDPTTLNRQGNDVGTQYRSIILPANEAEEKVARESIAAHQSKFKDPIVTEVEQLEVFYPAEDYHQDYFANNPNQPYCAHVIAPKLQKVLKD